MKKSCLVQESKVVTTQGTENDLNSSKDSKEQLTKEQLLINQKLLESGISDEGLGWLEKRNIFKTINVSLDTAVNENIQRGSPRLVKAANVSPAKWIENSFEDLKHEEKISKAKSVKKDSECALSRKSKTTPSQRSSNQNIQENIAKNNHIIETSSCGKFQKDSEINSDSPKCSKKFHSIKVKVEENSKEECEVLTEGKNLSVNPSKKRASQLEIELVETPKKLKMEETSNGVSPEEDVPLKIELDMENIKSSEPFKLRDIKSIVSEYEIRNKKWKETFLKYKCPARWGIPIVRNCSEKWDGKQIPPKLLQRYQKYLLSKNLTHPIFFPVKSQTSDLIKLSEISSPSSTCISSECTNETETNFKNLGEGSLIPNDSDTVGLENNLNVDSAGRMVLRSRTQQKTIISDDDISSDESDDWMDKQKSSKKQKINMKSKKAIEQSNKQLVLKLEKCDINREEGNTMGNKNSSKNDISFTGGSTMSSSFTSSSGGNFKSGSDPDTMVCPICSLRFKKQHIESHATECASKTYKD